jgi:hypothetical protein
MTLLAQTVNADSSNIASIEENWRVQSGANSGGTDAP